MPYLSIAMRSSPMPNAKPLYFSGSMPPARTTDGCTIPIPQTSSQPVPLQTRQRALAPPHSTHSMSSSIEGSVKGK